MNVFVSSAQVPVFCTEVCCCGIQKTHTPCFPSHGNQQLCNAGRSGISSDEGPYREEEIDVVGSQQQLSLAPQSRFKMHVQKPLGPSRTVVNMCTCFVPVLRASMYRVFQSEHKTTKSQKVKPQTSGAIPRARRIEQLLAVRLEPGLRPHTTSSRTPP